MLVNIDDNADNWLRWGQLVQTWVNDVKSRPSDAATMQYQMSQAGVTGSVPGADSSPPRPVEFYPYEDYPGTGPSPPLTMPLPSPKMLADAQTDLNTHAPELYPLHSFYPLAFGGKPEVTMNETELLYFELRRLGEYVILQCQ
ncbi:MAG TPA: hypothetical protein VFL55_24630 [Acetobacteraceae bacterium]|nr:hypothetical protein [Acetobacteraceae bacterium]